MTSASAGSSVCLICSRNSSMPFIDFRSCFPVLPAREYFDNCRFPSLDDREDAQDAPDSCKRNQLPKESNPAHKAAVLFPAASHPLIERLPIFEHQSSHVLISHQSL